MISSGVRTFSIKYSYASYTHESLSRSIAYFPDGTLISYNAAEAESDENTARMRHDKFFMLQLLALRMARIIPEGMANHKRGKFLRG